MQIKKYEASTMQEALETIKNELGPEAVILRTKENKGGFGLLSQSSVEVTVAVSERSLSRKKSVEKSLQAPQKEQLSKLSAKKQADLLQHYHERKQKMGLGQMAKEGIEKAKRGLGMSQPSAPQKKKSPTTQRYADIDPLPLPAASTPQRRVSASSAQKNRASQPVSEGMIPQVHHTSVNGAMAPQVHHTSASGAMVPQVHQTASSQHSSSPSERDELKRELSELKKMYQELRSHSGKGSGLDSLMQGSKFSHLSLRDAFEQLVVNGMEKKFALELIEKAKFSLDSSELDQAETVMDQIAYEVVENTEVMSLLEGLAKRKSQDNQQEQKSDHKGPMKVALVGPTGVGKTTTLAKIASDAILKKGLKVALINIDAYKVSAKHHLESYANILHAPFRNVIDQEELETAIEDFSRYDLVLIDTTGRSQKDTESLVSVEKMLQKIEGIRFYLVLSSTTRDTELYDAGNRFSLFRPDGLIMSKLDEAVTYGSIYNTSQKLKLPLVYFTTGQRVPEDMEEASKERMASLLLDLS